MSFIPEIYEKRHEFYLNFANKFFVEDFWEKVLNDEKAACAFLCAFYSAIKKGKKIGNFFLREDINGESFLFMPKYGGLNKRNSNNVIPTSIGKDGKKNYRLDVSNDYYIFDIAKNGNIINHAKLWYRKRS